MAWWFREFGVLLVAVVLVWGLVWLIDGSQFAQRAMLEARHQPPRVPRR